MSEEVEVQETAVAKDPVLIPDPAKNRVQLGAKVYEVKPLAFAPLKRAKALFQEIVTDLLSQVNALRAAEVKDSNVASIVGDLGNLFDTIFDRAPQLLCAFIPGLDPQIFEDDDGPTVAQITEAISVIVKVNGFDRLPNLLKTAMSNLR